LIISNTYFFTHYVKNSGEGCIILQLYLPLDDLDHLVHVIVGCLLPFFCFISCAWFQSVKILMPRSHTTLTDSTSFLHNLLFICYQILPKNNWEEWKNFCCHITHTSVKFDFYSCNRKKMCTVLNKFLVKANSSWNTSSTQIIVTNK
jgi:hypothetical protein